MVSCGRTHTISSIQTLTYTSPPLIPLYPSLNTLAHVRSMRRLFGERTPVLPVNDDVTEGLVRDCASYGATSDGSTLMDDPSPVVFATTWRRHFVLLVFSLLSCLNAGMWITFVAIEPSVKTYYGVHERQVNLLSIVFMVSYVILALPASLLLDQTLRGGLVAAALLTAVGGWLRWGASAHSFWLVVFGQTLAALGQLFVIGAPTKLSATWFPEREKALATTVGIVANQFGVASGFIISAVMVDKPSDIPRVLFVEALIGSGVLLLVLLFVGNRPAVPPSASEACKGDERPLSFLASIQLLLHDKNFLLLSCAFSILVGIFYSISTLVSEVLTPRGFSEGEVGRIGFVATIVGIAGALCMGFCVDRMRWFKSMNTAMYGLATVGIVWFTLATYYMCSFLHVVWSFSFSGIWWTAAITTSFELGLELTYPAGEAAFSSLLLIGANGMGMIITLILGTMREGSKGSMEGGCWLLVGLSTVALLSCCFIHGAYRRSGAFKEISNGLFPSLPSELHVLLNGQEFQCVPQMNTRRDRIVHELLSTEQTYVRYLLLCIHLYLIPLRDESSNVPLLPKKDVSLIFSNMEKLAQINHKLLKDLHERISTWTPSTCLGDTLLSHLPSLEAYLEYCENYDMATLTLQTHEQRADVSTFLKTLKSHPDMNDLTLDCFLVMPVSRLPRYSLLMADLLKCTPAEHPDCRDLEASVIKLQAISRQINEIVARQNTN